MAHDGFAHLGVCNVHADERGAHGDGANNGEFDAVMPLLDALLAEVSGRALAQAVHARARTCPCSRRTLPRHSSGRAPRRGAGGSL